jgi:hypothetical protein
MKKSIIFSFLAAMVLFACRKSDNPKIPELTRVPVPKLTVVANSDEAIDVVGNPANFKGNFNVGLLFPEDVKPQKVDVVVRKNGTGTVKVFKADVTAFPTSIQVTGQQLIDLFGPIVLGDYFDFATDIYLSNGLKIEAFPATGLQFSGGTVNIPTSSPTLRYTAICKYDPALYGTGNYVVIKDDWADYTPGTVVTLTQIDATHISFKYAANNATPIIITIDPKSNKTSVAKQTYGDYGGPYGIWSVATATSNDNVVLPCEKKIGVRLAHTSSNGYTGGNNTIVFQKQ